MGTQTIKLNSTASGGSDREKVHYGDAAAVSRGTFKLGTPNASGIAAVTGSGQDVAGTGRVKGTP